MGLGIDEVAVGIERERVEAVPGVVPDAASPYGLRRPWSRVFVRVKPK
jgi:hypothetical protein